MPLFSSIADQRSAIRYTTAAGQAIGNGSTPVIINFGTQDFAIGQGTVTTGASWKFTVAIAGVYRVTSHVLYSSATFSNENVTQLFLYKNGSEFSELDLFNTFATQSQLPSLSGTCDILCVVGDFLDLRTVHQESTSRSLEANAQQVYVSMVLTTPS